ncbi:MAG: hypothetical protein ACTTJH_00555 [Bacteroidales bacterium]
MFLHNINYDKFDIALGDIRSSIPKMTMKSP